MTYMTNTSVTKREKFQAVCLVCYTCELTKPVGKREAERACTSHQNAYGHNVTILTITK